MSLIRKDNGNVVLPAGTSGNTLYFSGYSNSETKIITQYQGTGASGNFVETKDVNGVAKMPRRVIVKATSFSNVSTGWGVFDSERGTDNFIYIEKSDEEDTISAIFDINTNGFTHNIATSLTNTTNEQYIAIVEFDTTGSNDDTYFDLPTDTTQAQITGGIASISNGFNTTSGVDNKIVSVNGTLIPTNNWQGE